MGKIVKVEMKWIKKKDRKESFQAYIFCSLSVIDQSGFSNCPWLSNDKDSKNQKKKM